MKKNSCSYSLHIFNAFKAKLDLYQRKKKWLINIHSTQFPKKGPLPRGWLEF